MAEQQGHNPTPVVDFETGSADAQQKAKQKVAAVKKITDSSLLARAETEKKAITEKIKGPIAGFLGPYKDKLSNFSDPIMKQVEEIQSYMDVQAMLLKVVPPIRIMVTNAFGDKIIGPQKILTEAQAMKKQLEMDINNAMTMVDDIKALPAQMNALANETIGEVYAAAGLAGGSLKDFSDLANGLQNDYTLSSIQDLIKNTPGGETGSNTGIANKDLFIDVVAGLKQKGITPVIDGPSVILVDDKGNKVIDFSNGIGPVGINLTATSQAKGAEQTVKSLVKVVISDFQFVALVSLISHIGSSNFAGSSVLRQLNAGNYDRVSNMIMRWRNGAISPNATGIVKQEYTDRRLFEAELFTTPDWVNFDYKPSEGSTLTWSQLTTELKEAKRLAMEELNRLQIDPSVDNGSDIT